VKPYFSLDAMLAAMFDCVGRLFGVQFVEQTGVPLYHPDVRLWEVRRGDEPVVLSRRQLCRPTSRGGAGCIFIAGNAQWRKVMPVVVNNNNSPASTMAQRY